MGGATLYPNGNNMQSNAIKAVCEDGTNLLLPISGGFGSIIDAISGDIERFCFSGSAVDKFQQQNAIINLWRLGNVADEDERYTEVAVTEWHFVKCTFKTTAFEMPSAIKKTAGGFTFSGRFYRECQVPVEVVDED